MRSHQHAVSEPTDPPALAGEPALSASEFFGGKTSEPRYVSLESKQSVAAPPKSAASVSTPASTPARQSSVPTPASSATSISQPVRHETAPPKSISTAPASASPAASTPATPSKARANASDDESTFPEPKPTPVAAASAVSSTPAVNGDAETSALRKENESLKVRRAHRRKTDARRTSSPNETRSSDRSSSNWRSCDPGKRPSAALSIDELSVPVP